MDNNGVNFFLRINQNFDFEIHSRNYCIILWKIMIEKKLSQRKSIYFKL